MIDIGLENTSVPRLVITQGEKAEYVALSHCWGGSNPVTTTTSTLNQRTRGIVFDENSRTFREAANVTRLLGMRYLWIDSLCVLQDSKEDWAKEAEKMSAVYNNATLTISASAALDSSMGLFPRTEDREAVNRTLKLPCPGPDGEQSYIYIRKHAGDTFKTDSMVHAAVEPEQSRLVTRGWVLQEELLSPRTLDFRKEELSWICSTYSRCECRLRPTLPLSHTFRGAQRAKPAKLEDVVDLFFAWPHLIMEFTKRNLTWPSDRLPALSGLAGWMEQRTGDGYFGGLWYLDLAFLLLWHTANGNDNDRETSPSTEPPTRFAGPYAPSWSWASISGPINYYGRVSDPAPGPKVKPLFRVRKVWAIPAGPNKYGPVGKSLLQISALVVDVRFDQARGQWIPAIAIKDLDPKWLKVSYDVPSECTLEKLVSNTYSLVLAAQWRSGDGMTMVAEQALCLLVRRMCQPEDHDTLFMTLLTFRTLINMGDSYVRVGLVRGAGSINAWKESVPESIVHLL